MRLFWHRRDLRVADNRGLAEAVEAATEDVGEDERNDGNDGNDGVDADDGRVAPVFVFDDDVLAHAAAPRVRYMLDALAALRDDYRERGSDLLVTRGDPAEALPRLADEHDAVAVHWNEDYSGLARERDARVRRALDAAGVERRTAHDAVHHEPGTITTNQGEPYSVFTYFWRKWKDRPKSAPFDDPAPEALAAVAGDDLPSIDDLGFSEPEPAVQEAGSAAARERLATFCDGPIFGYEEERDHPADHATSRLSADLKWGTIGVREVYAATGDALARVEGEDADGGGAGAGDGDDGGSTDDAADRADGPDEPDGPDREWADRGDERDRDDAERTADERAASVEEFRSQLAWREFYTQVLWANPNVVTSNYREYENDIEWADGDEADEHLRAWKEGRTGYPIVDAGMRQLREEAYMHNRLRMVVASFLTKDLLLDWRHGYEHFKDYLADHDAGNDNGGWQWAASTGTDAQPYFRVFNPMTQGERYDPDCEYVREYVPELRGVSPENVHSWHELSTGRRRQLADDYPDPIVDHSERREEAIAMFERARGDDEDDEGSCAD